MCLLPTQTPALLLRFLGPLYLRWTSLPLREDGNFFTASQMDGEYRISLTFGKCEVEEADFSRLIDNLKCSAYLLICAALQHTLHLCTTCRPTPEITWKKNGQQIVNGQNSFEIPRHYYGHRLIITNVNRESHQDVYTCEANNSRGNVYPMVRTINLEVKGKLSSIICLLCNM